MSQQQEEEMKMVNLSHLEDETKLRKKAEMECVAKDEIILDLRSKIQKLEEINKKLNQAEHYGRVKIEVLEDLQEKLLDKIR